jgi:hypothetical protein
MLETRESIDYAQEHEQEPGANYPETKLLTH